MNEITIIYFILGGAILLTVSLYFYSKQRFKNQDKKIDIIKKKSNETDKDIKSIREEFLINFSEVTQAFEKMSNNISKFRDDMDSDRSEFERVYKSLHIKLNELKISVTEANAGFKEVSANAKLKELEGIIKDSITTQNQK